LVLEQFRQLGKFHRNPARLVFGEQLGREKDRAISPSTITEAEGASGRLKKR
jgi:hypothetical protein